MEREFVACSSEFVENKNIKLAFLFCSLNNVIYIVLYVALALFWTLCDICGLRN